MRTGFWEILLIVILVLILFGHSKIPDLMKNLASGIKVFKNELNSKDEKDEKADKPVLSAPAVANAAEDKPVKKIPVSAKAKPVARKAPARKPVAKKK